MSIAEDLNSKLKNNRYSMYITDADDLLAAWHHRREKTSHCRCFDFSRVSQEYRLSAPPHDGVPLIPCHVTLRRKSSQVYKTIKPAPEYSTIACHGHGRKKSISTHDLDNLDALYAVSFARRNIAPYISPILDTATLTLVCKDLGITGQAIPKVIKGRQYIAFTNYAGLRNLFPGTLYLANNRKIIKMAIGSLGVKNMVINGGMLTVCITVPLTVLECFLRDPYSFSAFAGNLASDLMKIGIASIMGAIFGLAIGGVTTIAALPIAVTIGVSISANWVLEKIDRQYQLTEKLIAALQDMGDEIDRMENEAKTTIYRGMDGFFRSQGLRIPNY